MNNIPIIDLEKTGHNIRQLRVQNLLKVNDLQRIFGFAQPQSIYKWEQGKSLPTIDNLLVLSKIFGVSMDEIIVCRKVG
jgi:transcriptional regulator with XRE-family HTH domain